MVSETPVVDSDGNGGVRVQGDAGSVVVHVQGPALAANRNGFEQLQLALTAEQHEAVVGEGDFDSPIEGVVEIYLSLRPNDLGITDRQRTHPV